MVTVLIVDDHDGFRRQARRLLERAGYDVVGEADTGAAALAAARALRPEVVLLDIQLPDVDGFEVASRLDGPRVVLVSGRDGATYGDRLTRASAPFIAKADLTAQSLAAALEAR